MRLSVVTPVGVRSSDAGLLIAAAMERAGNVVDVVAVDQQLPLVAAVGYDLRGTDDPLYRRAMARHVEARVRAHDAEGVLVYGSNWALSARTLRRFRDQGRRVALWEVNNRLWSGAQASALGSFDAVFVLDSALVPVLRAAGLRQVDHLPACADPAVHRPLELTSAEQDRFGADISFIGTAHPDRIKLLAGLTDLRLRIYGVGWETAEVALARLVRTEPVYGRRKTAVYSASLTTVNVRGPHMLAGENFRVYEAALSGCVSLSQPGVDLSAALWPGEEVVVFDHPDDLEPALRSLLADPTRRAGMAAAARARVLAHHTYDHRAEPLLAALAA
jgi:spore maturation protein CgeB